jgi:hypothetical protein
MLMQTPDTKSSACPCDQYHGLVVGMGSCRFVAMRSRLKKMFRCHYYRTLADYAKKGHLCSQRAGSSPQL